MTNSTGPMNPGDALVVRDFIEHGIGLSKCTMLLEDRDWHRSRVIGDRSDIERTGVTFEMCTAFALAHDAGSEQEWAHVAWYGAPGLESQSVELTLTAVKLISGRMSLRHPDGRWCFLDTLDAIVAEAAGR